MQKYIVRANYDIKNQYYSLGSQGSVGCVKSVLQSVSTYTTLWPV